jgi:hypothetical protein
MGISWQDVEDACAENRELAGVIRQLERLHGGDTPIDWSEPRERCVEVLEVFRAGHQPSEDLTSLFEGTEYEVGGDEHHIVRHESRGDRVYKLTHSELFGCHSYFSPSDPELTGKHFHGSGNEDPIFYLRRWMLLNCVSGFLTRFEGLLPAEAPRRVPRVCVSQPLLPGLNPARSAIAASLSIYGFNNISEDAYLHPETGILLTDAAPRNVRIVDGKPVLFDAIAMLASKMVVAWVASQKC